MSYRVEWLIENEIFYVKFWGKSDANELQLALTDIVTMRELSPRDIVHTITHIHDMTSPVRFQDSMKVIKEFKMFNDDSWEIVVGKLDRIVKLSLSVSRSILQTKSINFETFAEAINHLKKEDTTLNWDNLNNELLENLRRV